MSKDVTLPETRTELVPAQHLGFLNTPPLWTNVQFGIPQFDFPEIALYQFNPTPIPSKLRLGHQMEHVFRQLITHCPDYEIGLHNLPIRRGKQTLGEIDFVLREVHSKALIHVELTYKFYILDPEITSSTHRFIGPNRRDMFFTKMEKIKNQQFRLLHTEEGKKALQAIGIAHDQVQHQACFKGQLFLPFGHTTTPIHPLNSDCICGYWLRSDDFVAKRYRERQFYIPTKSEWVITPHTDVEWTAHFDAQLEISLRIRNKNAPMVWMKKSEMEFEKFFVVWW